VRAKPLVTQITAAGSRHSPACHRPVDRLERLSGRNASPSGITPSNIMSPAPEPTRGSRTEVRLGARAHTIRCPSNRAHAPPAHAAVQPRQHRTSRLTCGPCTSKEKSAPGLGGRLRVARRRSSRRRLAWILVCVERCSPIPGCRRADWIGQALPRLFVFSDNSAGNRGATQLRQLGSPFGP
jgi:hypothetical protein